MHGVILKLRNTHILAAEATNICKYDTMYEVKAGKWTSFMIFPYVRQLFKGVCYRFSLKYTACILYMLIILL